MSSSKRMISEACNSTEFPGKSDDPISFLERNRLDEFIRSTFPSCQIQNIERLCNEYLYAAFKIKQFEMESAQVEEMIHATGAHKVSSIEKTNLDWRRVTRGLYGLGVSFSKNAAYANKYCTLDNGSSRAFIICDVLVKNVNPVQRNNFATYPVSPYDTYRSLDGSVYVKFEDFTFYPKYVVYYTYNKPIVRRHRRYR